MSTWQYWLLLGVIVLSAFFITFFVVGAIVSLQDTLSTEMGSALEELRELQHQVVELKSADDQLPRDTVKAQPDAYRQPNH
jgi:beta-lactam-binding protein with PASTA domain